jgi:hypothetical protein
MSIPKDERFVRCTARNRIFNDVAYCGGNGCPFGWIDAGHASYYIRPTYFLYFIVCCYCYCCVVYRDVFS